MTSSSMQRRALEDELRLVLEQKALIEQQLASLRSGSRSGPPVLKNLKRGGSSIPAKTHVPPTKRQKVEDRQKRINGLWGQMKTTLNQIGKQRDAIHFAHPVDVEKLKVPDYYKIIKHPMDLGTVKDKLEDRPEKGQPRTYQNPYEFASDVRQVWTNCRLYNPEGHAVRQMGDRLSDAWEKKWHSSGIEAKWESLMREEKEDELGAAYVPYQVKEMGKELRELTSQVPGKARGSSDSGPRDMTFEDKRRLSQQLGALPGERLQPVLDIVGKSAMAPLNEEGEAEVDIDALDNATLLELEAYVDSVLEELNKKQEAGRAPTPQSKVPGQPAAAPQQNGPEAAAAGAAAPSQPAAAAGNGGKSPAGTAAPAAPQPAASSGSSASSSSSSSSDDSMGEVGSKHDSGDATKAGADAAADQSTLVSATHPQQAPPIYQPKSRKDVMLQNEGAWGALAAAKPADSAKADGSAAAAGSDPGSGAPGEQDPLWSEFASREAQQRKREADKAAEEDKRRAEKAKAEAEARKEADKRQAEAAATVAAERAKQDASAAAAEAELEEQRRREMEALQDSTTDAQGVGPQGGGRVEGAPGGGNVLASLGLFTKSGGASSSSSGSSSSSSSSDDDDADTAMPDAEEKEEGEA